MPLSLKQKSSLFVAFSAVLLLAAYSFFVIRYIRQQTDSVLAQRGVQAQAIASDADDFLDFAGSKLNQIAVLPGFVFGLQNFEAQQKEAAEGLHYLFFQSDVFTAGVFLVNANGKILWSSDQARTGSVLQDYPAIHEAIVTERDRKYVLTMADEETEKSRILVSSPIIDRDDNIEGAFVGAIPIDHPKIIEALDRQAGRSGIAAQIVDPGGLVIASSDAGRILRQLPYREQLLSRTSREPQTRLVNNSVVAFAAMKNAPWTVTLDQDKSEALVDVDRVQFLLTTFGLIVIAVAMTILFFVVRSFTKPIELLTEEARLIAAGDLNVRFTSGRTDEIGILSSALDEMKSKVKASYELLLESEKMSLMGQVVAGIAHELNNPLTIVIGHTQLLLDEQIEERLKKPLSRIHDGAERASKIVKNLLTFTRQQKPERKATDVNAVVMRTVDLRAYELRVSDIQLTTELLPVPLTMADPHQLQQVFLNLIVNAEQAMLEASGRGTLTVKSFVQDDQIVIVFEDDGPGIPEESLRRIFDPFFTTKPVGQGTGLGLSICQGIIAEHGGRLSATSGPGLGARFTVELPVVETSAKLNPMESPISRVSKRRNILIVDDEGYLRELFFELLSRDGHRVHTAANGTEALELIHREYFDLVVTDIKMPETDGIELYKILKNDGSDLAERVLFITGDIMDSDTLHFLESTGNPWIAKPFEMSALREAANKALTTRRT